MPRVFAGDPLIRYILQLLLKLAVAPRFRLCCSSLLDNRFKVCGDIHNPHTSIDLHVAVFDGYMQLLRNFVKDNDQYRVKGPIREEIGVIDWSTADQSRVGIASVCGYINL